MNEKKLMWAFIGVAVLISAWLSANYSFQVGTIYVLFAFSGFMFLQMSKKKEIDFVSDKGVLNDVIIGLLVAGGWILVFSVGLNNAINLGVPTPPAEFLSTGGDAGKFIVTSFLAPTIEEFMFRGTLLPFMASFIGGVPALVGQSLLFAFYHFSAYGVGMSSAFVSASLFGLLLGLLYWRYKFPLLSLIVAHAGVNAVITLSQFVIIV